MTNQPHQTKLTKTKELKTLRHYMGVQIPTLMPLGCVQGVWDQEFACVCGVWADG